MKVLVKVFKAIVKYILFIAGIGLGVFAGNCLYAGFEEAEAKEAEAKAKEIDGNKEFEIGFCSRRIEEC